MVRASRKTAVCQSKAACGVVNMRKRKQTEDEMELAESMRKALERDHNFTVPDPNVVKLFRNVLH